VTNGVHRALLAAMVLLAGLRSARAAGAEDFTRDDPRDIYGVWWRGGANPAALKQRCPWVKGVFVAIRWRDLEPADGKFDWAMFDRTMKGYAEAPLWIQFMVWVGPDSPRWIYEAGVPEVKTTPSLNPHGKPHRWTYPFYLDPKYKQFYRRMIREVAAHVDALPMNVRERIVCVQTAEGTTGDEGGYKGRPLDKRFELPEEKWNTFKFETWELFDRLYRDKQPKIHLLINSGNGGQYDKWINENLPDTWRKAGNPGHGYQLNNEMSMFAFFDPLVNRPNRNGHFVRCRSEMDEMFKGWFRENPVWNMYWLNLWGLTFGLDIFQHETQAFENPAFEEGFVFYSRYGGKKDPATSPGAWCAMHDGLDAGDFERFPPEKFGSGHFKDFDAGKQRCLNIAKAFARYGAAQEDAEKAMYLVMKNRDAAAMNDVGWNIWADNYQRYMTQYDPNGTSRGYWRQGPKDQPYGRFARGFDAKAGKDKMFFDINDAFFGGKPLADSTR